MKSWKILRDVLKHKILKNYVLMSFSNIILLIAKILAWLVVPKMLGVIEYGYYKTFTLYLVYTAFFHFGFPDGILLLHGGQNYAELDKTDFRTYSKFYIILEAIISLIIITVSLFFNTTHKYILILLSLDTLFVNITVYFKYISQAVMRFKQLSKQNIMQGILQIGIIILFGFLKCFFNIYIDGKIYISSIVVIDCIIFLWYMVVYFDLIFGKCIPVYMNFKNIKLYLKNGIVLTFSYQVATLIYNLDAQMVLWLFDVHTYSLYAFAYTIIRLVTNTIGTISTVLFPTLCEMGEKNALEKFPLIMSIISILASAMLIVFFPISCFIRWYIPDYTESLKYLKIIMPGLAISCCISMVIFTYYKVIKKLREYTVISLIVLIIGLFLNGFGYIIIKQPFIFSTASIFTCFIWYILAVKYISNKFHISWRKNFLYICIQISVFYIAIYLYSNLWEAACIYFSLYCMATFLFYKKELYNILKSI